MLVEISSSLGATSMVGAVNPGAADPIVPANIRLAMIEDTIMRLGAVRSVALPSIFIVSLPSPGVPILGT
jgi:hypothetical protein